MSKGSDINVGSIEEAVEILRNAIRCNEKQFEELGTHILLQEDEEEAIKIVLGNLEILSDMQRTADRELENARRINEEHQKINGELREKVKELEEKLKKQKKLTMLAETINDESIKEALIEFEKEYIPKQKIKDKIEELKEDKESKYYYSFLEERDIEKTIEILQELLQEEENDANKL